MMLYDNLQWRVRDHTRTRVMHFFCLIYWVLFVFLRLENHLGDSLFNELFDLLSFRNFFSNNVF
jgi:hypothetical protein